MTDKATFKITVRSPWGRKPLDKFEHWINKVASDASERWGIDIQIDRVDVEEQE